MTTVAAERPGLSHPPLTLEQVKAALAYALSVVRQDELLLNA